MGIWDELLHPRTGGRFAAKPKKFTAGRPYGSSSVPGSGHGGRKGTGKGKAKGPSRSELGAVGQVMAGNAVTTDGGKTWSVLGAKTPGTLTKAVLAAERDGLLNPPGKGANRPTLTRTGAADYRRSGMKPPPAKAPILAARTARTQAARARAQQVAARRSATAAIRAAKAALPPPAVRLGAVRQTVSARNRGR